MNYNYHTLVLLFTSSPTLLEISPATFELFAYKNDIHERRYIKQLFIYDNILSFPV